ncbi:MAG: hypothetical protein HY908_00770 [Myxococcales bacterium]|nr:hypothetical protein [Myxococcales bacterium]
MTSPRLTLALAAACSALGVASAAAGGDEGVSGYERETLDAALGERGASVDPEPEGKTIEAVEIAVLDVIEERDPLPDFLNWLHTNTRDHIVARELLFAKGERYAQASVDETKRNLRERRQFSVVLLVPVRGSRPDAVRMLVVVKDTWSLRLNSDIRLQGGRLEHLYVQPTEENLAGTHRGVFVDYEWLPLTSRVGGQLLDPHLAGTRHLLRANANVALSHDSGAIEGTEGSFTFGLPSYSLQQQWAWGLSLAWDKEITRRYIGVEVARFDARSTPGKDGIPWVYATDRLSGRVAATRSFGDDYRHDITFGWQVDRGLHDPGDLSSYDPRAVEEFLADSVPVSDVRVGPTLGYRLHGSDYATLLDAETLALQEDYALGPDLFAGVHPVVRALGSSRNLVQVSAAASYTAVPARALVRVYGAASADLELGGSEAVASAGLQVGVRLTSPPFGFGRLVYDGTVGYRPRNYLNDSLTVGGESRLRGYRSGQFSGENLVASNLELRTLPVQLWTLQVAGTAFYDVGDAFDGNALRPKQGAGLGLRVLIPQAGRAVLRLDWGFPLTASVPRPSPFDGLVVTFGQAFGLPKATSSGIDLGLKGR